MSIRHEPVANAIRRACFADVAACKPGNVAIGRPANAMAADDFLLSADAIAGPLSKPQGGLGERIETAVEATWQAVGCNTNLGIVLLLAPMAMAALPGPGWRGRLARVIAGADANDGRALARAIARMTPAGLGDVATADVRDPSFNATPLEAMTFAADRDLIARQYRDQFADVFGLAARYVDARSRASHEDATTAVFLIQLAAAADSHICRKHGAVAGEQVRSEAAVLVAELPSVGTWDTASAQRIAAFDDALRKRHYNPGTTADMTVAAVFAAELDAIEDCRHNGGRPAFLIRRVGSSK